ncbi:hypothetical protein GGTG_11576 [Gaeumannomyces tritici R3-111a-1]|uniref:Uncharacterized protein n=1 Tax=Gaeumannomyces tritici (strain R3-111a-1) TaxID=644352 RepID=J3PDK3_GAET3|nr:hypothetical protein GGTG_11576 [Gaeumannomyces tritici R3-111a-1]EJT70553.1 hypothetical protein GGTG_11576 [Gaeumannomyces tritici R3-111a-1]
MPDALQPRQRFEALRASLFGLSEALFDKAPFSRQGSTGGFRGSGPELVTISRGLGSADLVLRRFEESWHGLRAEDRQILWDEWDALLTKMLSNARQPCMLCHVAPGTDATSHPSTGLDCASCGTRVALYAEELESCASRLTETLKNLAPISTGPAPPVSPAPTDVALSFPAVGSEGNCKIAEAKSAVAEAKCVEYSETLQQTQNELEAANAEKTSQAEELEHLRKEREDLQASNTVFEGDLKVVMEMVEQFAEDLDVLMRWGSAQLAYAQLDRMLCRELAWLPDTPETEQQRGDLKVKSMRFRHKQSVALMRLGRPQEAEDMCREVYEEKAALEAGTSKAVVRSLLKDYCDILVKNGKFDIAEQQYQLVLWTELGPGTTDREDEKERSVIYSRLGDIKMEQKRYVDAARLHKDALEKVMELLPLDVDQAAECAVKCLGSQRMQDDSFAITDNTIGKHLETIWVSRQQGSEKRAVLECGHEHGVRLLNDDKDEDAATALSTVWERRKALGESYKSASMETALCLVDVSVKMGNTFRLESLYHWITQNATAEQGEADRLWARYRLGCVQAILRKNAVAENNLRRALRKQQEVFGKDDPDTLQYTQVLAEVLRRSDHGEDAIALVRDAWEAKKRYPRGSLLAVLRIGHLYGDILSESNMPKDLATAEAVLREVWEDVHLNLSTMAISASELTPSQLSGLVSAGDCYAFVMLKRSKFAQAKEVLQPVLDWKMWLKVEAAAIERTKYLIGKSNELELKEAENKKIKYQPTTPPHYHPLRLRHLLDRWFSTGTVSGLISDA